MASVKISALAALSAGYVIIIIVDLKISGLALTLNDTFLKYSIAYVFQYSNTLIDIFCYLMKFPERLNHPGYWVVGTTMAYTYSTDVLLDYYLG